MSKIVSATFQSLYNTAKTSTEEAQASDPMSPSKKVQEVILDRLGDAAKAARVATQKAKLNFSYFEKKKDEQDITIDGKTTVATVVNWLVEMFKDVIDKINDQGELMAAIMKKLGDDGDASN